MSIRSGPPTNSGLILVADTTLNTQADNLATLNRVRAIALIGQAALVLFATFSLDLMLPIGGLIGLWTFELLFQLFSVWFIRRKGRVSQFSLFVTLLIDSLILAAMIYLTGGANNPFIYLLLLSVALASFMLSPYYLIAIVITQLLLYSLLNYKYRSLVLAETSPLASFHLHLAGMWVNFILTVILIAFFGWVTRTAMLKQEKKLQTLREKNLRDEQVLGLGIMSANAAHEMGTPLSTMAVLVEDLSKNKQGEEENDFQLLANQIERCKQIIKSLHQRSRQAQESINLAVDSKADSIANTSVTTNVRREAKDQLVKLFEQWLVYRPDIQLKQTWQLNQTLYISPFAISLEQAIMNLLDNAADASIKNGKNEISVVVGQQIIADSTSLVIDIYDRGEGIDQLQDYQKVLSDSSKPDGFGWGLFLSNISIERAQGRVTFFENETIGGVTRIQLPLVDGND